MIPPLDRTIAMTDVVAYAGATWDWHPIHHDPGFLAEKGLDRAVVDGQMLGALMAEQVLDHFGPRAFLSALSIRYTSIVFAGDTVRVVAESIEPDEAGTRIRQRLFVGDRVVAEGMSTVRGE